MRRVLMSIALTVVFLSPALSMADTVFQLNGTLQDGTGHFTGTLTYGYYGLGHVTGTLTDGSYVFTVPNNYLGETIGENTFTHVDIFAIGSDFDLSFYVPRAIGPNGNGGPICSLTFLCMNPGAPIVTSSFYEGYPGHFPTQQFQTITATAPTPEPGTLGLLITGLGGMLCGFSRRSARE